MVAQTLQELGVTLPSNSEAAKLQLTRVRVQRIVDGTMTQVEALAFWVTQLSNDSTSMHSYNF